MEGKPLENHAEWKAKLALFCYFGVIGGIFLGSIIVELVLLGLQIDYLDLPFPLALISLPVNELIILGVTLVFARHKRASWKELGLKRTSLRILTIVTVATVPLYLMGVGISIGQEVVLGPDPTAELVAKLVIPRDALQLVAMIVLSLVLVGPVEEVAFRGFVQKGFENSFGKTKGLLIASALFGIGHSLVSPYSVIPTTFGGLILGYVWQKTGENTTASALMHGIYDSIAIALAYFLTI